MHKSPFLRCLQSLCLCCNAIEVMVHLCGVIILHGGRCIVKRSQEVLPNITDVSGVVLEALEHLPDMASVQLQQPGLYNCLGQIIPTHPDILPVGADRLHHQLHHLV